MEFIDNISEEGERRVKHVLNEVLDLLDEKERKVVLRAIRSTGDLDLIGTLRFSRRALEVGPKLVKNGVLVDTRMAREGLGSLGEYVEPTSRRSRYLAQDMIESWRDKLKGKVVMIGTSPLALEKLLDLVEEGIRPELIVGVPVGFVNALHAKYRLSRQSSVEYITNISVKGGVALGVSIVRALMEIG
ncbi:hypothetical protein L3N51_00323 [Metallosphaera sp. J1]|uniref:precorrin-8X methylmutase n=1 Tax=Metallosphaera TaxID=41980 RepID=UPI001EDD8DC3|nr:precorrin-8X methylmutase [Metallosphaera javensis (ex Hofmann et al. 2022)]MCG3108045.1 hypothetical protein [Metallosphaera javensis (ex Hofmann et al. 2022)]BCS91796.1 MAG: precorrin-8X methylmutase [Metallosphaera javensis (ex Sakai et al. 2022)]